MKKPRTKKQPNDYPRMTIRIDPGLLARIEGVRTSAGLSQGQVVAQALRRFLPDLEKFHNVEAATK